MTLSKPAATSGTASKAAPIAGRRELGGRISGKLLHVQPFAVRKISTTPSCWAAVIPAATKAFAAATTSSYEEVVFSTRFTLTTVPRSSPATPFRLLNASVAFSVTASASAVAFVADSAAFFVESVSELSSLNSESARSINSLTRAAASSAGFDNREIGTRTTFAPDIAGSRSILTPEERGVPSSSSVTPMEEDSISARTSCLICCFSSLVIAIVIQFYRWEY